MTPPPRLGRRLFRVVLALFLSTLAGVGIGGIVLWRTGWFDRLELDVEARVIEAYVRDLQPHLPFRIEKFEVRKDWRHVLSGQIDEVYLALRFDSSPPKSGGAEGHWRLKLRGPVSIGRAAPDAIHPGERHYQVTFSPDANLEKLDAKATTLGESPPFKLRLWVRAAQNLRHVDTVGLETDRTPGWRWKPVGIELEDFSAHATWEIEDGKARLAARAKVVHWSAADGTRDIRVTRPDLSVTTPLAISAEKPLTVGPEMALRFAATDAETLWGDTYVDLPLKVLPMNATVELEQAQGKPRVRAFDAQIGTVGAQARLQARIEGKRVHLHWRDGGLKLRETVAGLLSVTAQTGPLARALAPLRALEIRNGQLHADLALDVPLDFATRPDPARIRGEGRIEFRDVGFDDRAAKLAVRGLDLTLPYSGARGVRGEISARALGYRKFRGKLGPTPIRLRARTSGVGWDAEIGDVPGIPLHIDGVPLRLGRVRGTVGAESGPEGAYHLTGSLAVPSAPLEKLMRLACARAKRIPPASFMAELKEIELRPGSIEPAGYARIELFDGFAEANELGVYRLGQPVPELDFNLRFNGIRLDQLGEWVGFGEMDGILTGFAHDVTFQGWLPTQYEIKVEAKPFRRGKIVFSPDAMKNFTRLIIADTIDKLPGVADWLAFGWPSRLFNGYDVNYLGIYLFSYDGTILLETIDPPEIYKRERKRYILYGPRFKMPLVSKSYPVAADATAVANLVQHMTQQVNGLIEKKNVASGGHAKNDEDDDCLPVL